MHAIEPISRTFGATRTVTRFASLAALLIFLCVPPVSGYGGDTHYYLHFAAALDTCFDWDEAHLIASADYLLDKNRTTTAEKHPFKQHNKINWHAFGRPEERFNELWERVINEQDPELQLVKLGQFLHFASDWESHYGYGTRMGHGVTSVVGEDPDSLGYNKLNNLRMVAQILDHLYRVCAIRGRTQTADTDRSLVTHFLALIDDPMLGELHASNSPKWKTFGKRGKKAKRMLANNHRLIEEYVERRSKPVPEKNVPADFSAGDPEHGIPPPIGIRYDKNGELEEIFGVELELLPEFDGTELSRVEEDRLEAELETEYVDELQEDLHNAPDPDLYSNVELHVNDVDLKDDGWLVQVEIENLGSGDSSDGQLKVFILHVASEELLGETIESVPQVKAGDDFRHEVFVEAEGEPAREILVGVVLDIPDLSADNNDSWFVPWKEELEAIEGKKAKKKREPGPVEFLGPPEMWVASDSLSALRLRAVVSGGDSSRRLGNLELAFADDGDDLVQTDVSPTIWSSDSGPQAKNRPGQGDRRPPPQRRTVYGPGRSRLQPDDARGDGQRAGGRDENHEFPA